MTIGTSGRRAFALRRSSRPVIPGMLMSERTRISERSPTSAMHCSAIGADCANSIVKRSARRSRRNCWRNSTSTSASSSTTRISMFTPSLPCPLRYPPRQYDPKFGECSGLGVDLYRSAMLLDDDVMTDGQAQSGSFAGGLGRKERIEHLLLHLGRHAGAVVADPDLDAVAEILGRGSQNGLVAASIRFRLTLRRSVEAV